MDFRKAFSGLEGKFTAPGLRRALKTGKTKPGGLPERVLTHLCSFLYLEDAMRLLRTTKDTWNRRETLMPRKGYCWDIDNRIYPYLNEMNVRVLGVFIYRHSSRPFYPKGRTRIRVVSSRNYKKQRFDDTVIDSFILHGTSVFHNYIDQGHMPCGNDEFARGRMTTYHVFLCTCREFSIDHIRPEYRSIPK